MTAANDRLEFRVHAARKARIARAATILQVTLGEFARTAAEEKADEVIREHEATTVVPAGFFDAMIAAFDEPPVPAPVLVDAMKRARDTVSRA